jgi:hypothetical protein
MNQELDKAWNQWCRAVIEDRLRAFRREIEDFVVRAGSSVIALMRA